MIIEGTNKQYTISANDCFYSMLCRSDNKTTLCDDDIQNYSGIYVFYDWNDKPIRIGRAVKLRNRILQYATSPANYNLFSKMDGNIQNVSVIYEPDDSKRCKIEIDLINKHNPPLNTHTC